MVLRSRKTTNMAFYFKTELKCFKDNSKCRTVFMKCYDDQTVGDAVYSLIGEWNVVVDEISAKTNESDTGTSTPPDTPVSVLRGFGTKFLAVTIRSKDVEKETDDSSGSKAKNAFSILMNINKSYTELPEKRNEINSKDNLYNLVLKIMKERGVGFTPLQVGTMGKNIVKTLSDTLWYLDPHVPKFEQRGIYFHGFENFRGFNDWRAQKKKEPRISAEELHVKLNSLVDMLSLPYFLSKKGAEFGKFCSILVEGMKKYFDFLEKQNTRSKMNNSALEPVRSLTDSWLMRAIPISDKLEPNYAPLHEALNNFDVFEPLFLYNIQPDDRFDRRNWIQKLTLPYPCKLYSHSFGNYFGNFNFVWKISKDEDSAEGDLEAVGCIRNELPIYSTRAMRKEFVNRYSKCGMKPAILRDVRRFLTQDSSFCDSSKQQEVDERFAEWLLSADDTQLFYDLRRNNGRPKDEELNPFWEGLESYLSEHAVVHERRHSQSMYMPLAMSVEDLIDIISKRIPEGSKIPSKSWVSFNFWPSNPYVKSAMNYTGRFQVKYAVQQRLTRAKHPDSSFAFHQFRMMKEMAVKYAEQAQMICLDDKAIVPVGEPQCPISTNVRPHNRALLPVGATLSALDHDFHVHAVIPSVLFKIDIPESADDSFYYGKVHVTVKDKVFQSSNAIRHCAENVRILREEGCQDGVALSKPILFVFTDGGPDHRSTYWSVQLSYIAMFVALDLDLLVTARTAPSQSYNNPAERCMSLLNIALQNTALQREKMEDQFEFKVKSLSSLKKIRDAAEKQPQLKNALIESLEPIQAMLKLKFSKLKLHGEPVTTHDALKDDDIQDIFSVLDIFKDDDDSPPISSCKDAKHLPEKLKQFIDNHCRARHYSFQVKNCGQCWYCILNPPKLQVDQLHWLPDPTLGENGEYLDFSEIYGRETSDKNRPSCLLKEAASSEQDRLNKRYLNAAQVRTFIICRECGKRRVIYCAERLNHDQIREIEKVQDTLDYVCGSTLFPFGSQYFATVFVRESQECANPIETTYYSGVCAKFADICFFCGDLDVAGGEDPRIQSYTQKFSIVRPICFSCLEERPPAVRNAKKIITKK